MLSEYVVARDLYKTVVFQCVVHADLMWRKWINFGILWNRPNQQGSLLSSGSNRLGVLQKVGVLGSSWPPLSVSGGPSVHGSPLFAAMLLYTPMACNQFCRQWLNCMHTVKHQCGFYEAVVLFDCIRNYVASKYLAAGERDLHRPPVESTRKEHWRREISGLSSLDSLTIFRLHIICNRSPPLQCWSVAVVLSRHNHSSRSEAL